ncbi:unnamed protein product, partial [Didymodactylos carnosus]
LSKGLGLQNPSIAFVEDQHTIWLHQRQQQIQAQNAALLRLQQLPEFLPPIEEEYLDPNADDAFLLPESAQRTANIKTG